MTVRSVKPTRLKELELWTEDGDGHATDFDIIVDKVLQPRFQVYRIVLCMNV